MWETAIILGVLGSVFLWVFLSFNISDEHVGIKLLLLLMGTLGIGLVLFLTMQIAELNDSGVASVIEYVYTGYIYIFIAILFFIIMPYVIAFVRFLLAPKERMKRNLMGNEKS